MGMTRAQRIENDFEKGKASFIAGVDLVMKTDWHQKDWEIVAKTLDLPVTVLDDIMRAWHIGPYDRRKEPRIY